MSSEQDAKKGNLGQQKLTRRDLLKLGATTGLAAVGLAACSQPAAPAATTAPTAKPAATTAPAAHGNRSPPPCSPPCPAFPSCRICAARATG